MLRFLHLADLHLGAKPAYLGELADARGQDFLQAFERAVDFAVDDRNNIHLVIIAGDFFDSPAPSSDTSRFAVKQLRRLQKVNIPVVLAPGNHDALGYPRCVYMDTESEVRDLVHLITSPNVKHNLSLELNGETVHFYGMAWSFGHSHPPFDEFVIEEEGGFHIAVLHGTVTNGLYRDVHNRSVPLELSHLAHSKMNYIALGHLHAYQLHKAGSISVVYPGTLEGVRFNDGETGERSLVVVTLEKGTQPQIEQRPWNQRSLEVVRIDLGRITVESNRQLAELIRENYADPNNLIRLELVGTASFVLDIETIHDLLDDQFFWFELRDNTTIFDSALIETWAKEKTVRGFFVHKIKEKIEAASEEDRRSLEAALKLGCHAFEESI